MTFVRFIESSNREIRYGLLKEDIVQLISGSPFSTWLEKDEQFLQLGTNIIFYYLTR